MSVVEQALGELREIQSASDDEQRWERTALELAGLLEGDLPLPFEEIPSAELSEWVIDARGSGSFDQAKTLGECTWGALRYELAAALPDGELKSELLAEVRAHWQQGAAAESLAIAERMALSCPRDLLSEEMAPRLGLCFALGGPAGFDGTQDLAFYVISHPTLFQRWVEEAAFASIPHRRLAGAIVAAGALGIQTRVNRGRDWVKRVWTRDSFRLTVAGLLADREPLVWRHAAIARGRLVACRPDIQEGLVYDLEHPEWATPWRRALASTVAAMDVAPEWAWEALRGVFDKGLLLQQPSLAPCILWGLASTWQVDDEKWLEALELCLNVAPLELAECWRDLKHNQRKQDVLEKVEPRLKEALIERAKGIESTKDAWVQVDSLLGELRRAEHSLSGTYFPAFRETIENCLQSYAEESSGTAYELAREGLDQCGGGVAMLELLDTAGPSNLTPEERSGGFRLLRDLDQSLAQDGALHNLLSLGQNEGGRAAALDDLREVRERVMQWIITQENVEARIESNSPHSFPPTLGRLRSSALAQAPRSLAPVAVSSPLRVSHLRALLHFVDTRAVARANSGLEQLDGTRWAVVQLMLEHLLSDVPKHLLRVVCATLGRALDALVRLGDCHESEAMLLLIRYELPPKVFEILSEASSAETLKVLLRAFANFAPMAANEEQEGPTSSRPTDRHPADAEAAAVARRRPFGHLDHQIATLEDFARLLPEAAESQSRCLHETLMTLASCLQTMLDALSLQALCSSADGPSVLERFDEVISDIYTMVKAAEQQVKLAGIPPILPPTRVFHQIREAVEQERPQKARVVIRALEHDLNGFLPVLFMGLLERVVGSLHSLPLITEQERVALQKALPDWLSEKRELGAYRVIESLGSGAQATVFAARRLSDGEDESSERFALKVPMYPESAKGVISETEFLELFREEAFALLGLPQHENLAGFVTFDLAVRPKPILVMELVEGLTLADGVEGGLEGADQAIALSLGILKGLEAMHAEGIAHLDLKPSNVILRDKNQPVLVDFGLAGRKIKPGCGTIEYGAPEIWVDQEDGRLPEPLPADVYSACCVIFEIFTGVSLFGAGSDMQTMAAHMAHDGMPRRLKRLAALPRYAKWAEWLSQGLARTPKRRGTVRLMRLGLQVLAPRLGGLNWPFKADEPVMSMRFQTPQISDLGNGPLPEIGMPGEEAPPAEE